MTTFNRSQITSSALAVATALLSSISHAGPPVTQADLAQAQADGLAFGSAVQSAPLTPAQQAAAPSLGITGSSMSSTQMPPGANNVMGAQYTGTPDAGLTSQVTTPSLNTTGATAKSNSVSGFTGYSNVAADQGNQAAYFVATGNIHRATIAGNDPIAGIAKSSPVATPNQGNSSTACVTTTNAQPGNLGNPHVCIDSFTPYVTSCSLDKSVNVIMVPVCNATISGSSTFPQASPPMSQAPSVACLGSNLLMIGLGSTNWGDRCYSGLCASFYYDAYMFISPGFPSSSCSYTAQTYLGVPWGQICGSYDGFSTITISPWSVADIAASNHPGGTITIDGGYTFVPQLSYGADINYCVPLNGFL